MYYAFSEPFPLRHAGLNRTPAHNIVSTTSCASRSPRVSTTSKAQVPNKKRARPRAPAFQTQKNEPTVAELSAHISQTIGLHIIKSDLDNLYSFFRSFVKVKTVNQNDHLPNQPSTNSTPPADSGHESKSNIEDNVPQATASSENVRDSFTPKSMLGKAVASNYVAMRGSLDRTMESLSLATQSLLLSMIATAGSTMYSILDAGQKAFPALDFSTAKHATQQMIQQRWNPLNSFQWQAMAISDARKLSESRRERVEYVKQYLRGKSGGPWTQTLTFASRSVSTTFSVFENVTPALIQGASRFASAGYGGLKAIGHWGATGSKAHVSKKHDLHVLRSFRTGVAFLDKLPSLSSSSAKETVRRKGPLVAGKNSSVTKENSSRHMKLSSSLIPNGLRKMKLRGSEKDKGENSSVQNVEVAQTRNSDEMLEKGGAILGTGMLLMAASGISLPVAVTCSAVVITTVGVAQAKAGVSKNDIHQEARAVFRQSRSVRELEKAFLPRRRAPSNKLLRKDNLPELEVPHSKQAVSTPAASTAKIRHGLPGVGTKMEDTVDVKPTSIGQSEPSILSAPVLGKLLNTTDDVAYKIETISSHLFPRLETVLSIQQATSTWVLLKSFRRKP